MVRYYSKRYFFKKKKFLQRQCLHLELADTGAATSLIVYIPTADISNQL